MSPGPIKEFKCLQCNAVFDTQGKRSCHVDRTHRQYVDITFPDGTVKTIVRNHSGQIVCACGRTFALGKSLVRHAKTGCKFLAEQHLKERAEIGSPGS